MLYNIESDEDVTFITDSNGQMLALTSNSLYKICVVKVNNNFSDAYSTSCPNVILDQEGNKCQAQCDEGKIKMMPEGICINKALCDLNINVYNADETECGLCKYFNPNGAKYKIINTINCIEEIPDNAEYYNENQKLLKCKINYH